MNSLLRSVCSALLMLALTGCAYVEFRRAYEVRPELSVSQRIAVNEVVEHYFTERGLLLKLKYHDYYPEDKYVTVLEIPRKPEEKRRYPTLQISVDSSGRLQLIHTEWFLNEKPNDLVAMSGPDIVELVNNALNIRIELNLVQKGYY